MLPAECCIDPHRVGFIGTELDQNAVHMHSTWQLQPSLEGVCFVQSLNRVLTSYSAFQIRQLYPIVGFTLVVQARPAAAFQIGQLYPIVGFTLVAQARPAAACQIGQLYPIVGFTLVAQARPAAVPPTGSREARGLVGIRRVYLRDDGGLPAVLRR
jgi:hypothetical protein